MRKNILLSAGISSLFLVSWLAALSAEAKSGGLPQALLNAHSVYIENETGFADLKYAAILELEKWGRFEVADSREKADLIFRLDNGAHVRELPEGQLPSSANNAGAEGAVPSGYTRIALLDSKSGQVLWSGIHKTEGGKVKSGHLLDGLRDVFRDYDKGKR
jgi:hypothetical protein